MWTVVFTQSEDGTARAICKAIEKGENEYQVRSSSVYLCLMLLCHSDLWTCLSSKCRFIVVEEVMLTWEFLVHSCIVNSYFHYPELSCMCDIHENCRYIMWIALTAVPGVKIHQIYLHCISWKWTKWQEKLERSIVNWDTHVV